MPLYNNFLQSCFNVNKITFSENIMRVISAKEKIAQFSLTFIMTSGGHDMIPRRPCQSKENPVIFFVSPQLPITRTAKNVRLQLNTKSQHFCFSRHIQCNVMVFPAWGSLWTLDEWVMIMILNKAGGFNKKAYFTRVFFYSSIIICFACTYLQTVVYILIHKIRKLYIHSHFFSIYVHIKL